MMAAAKLCKNKEVDTQYIIDKLQVFEKKITLQTIINAIAAYRPQEQDCFICQNNRVIPMLCKENYRLRMNMLQQPERYYNPQTHQFITFEVNRELPQPYKQVIFIPKTYVTCPQCGSNKDYYQNKLQYLTSDEQALTYIILWDYCNYVLHMNLSWSSFDPKVIFGLDLCPEFQDYMLQMVSQPKPENVKIPELKLNQAEVPF